MRRWLLAFVALGVLTGVAAGQDNHYWTTQYGNRARLLEGAVVGSSNDSSAVYYNPGALARMDEPELLLSGTVIQYETVRISDALGPGRNLSDSRWFLAPSMIAGELRLKALGKNRIAYAFLTRYDAEFRVTERAETTAALEAGIPGIGFASTGVSYETRLREYWFGGSWSRKFGDRIGIGVSPFVAVRNHRGRAQALLQSVGDGGQAGITISSRDFDYQHWRLLTKIGISAGWETWEMGVTVTTPSLGLFGNGWTGLDRSAAGPDVDPEEIGLGRVATDFQEDLKPDYRSPLSIAFGAARRFGRSRVDFTAEWFDSIGPTNLLEPKPFESQSSGETIQYDIRYALDAVANAAIGFEHRFRNNLQIYGAFSTDFSAVSKSFRAQAGIASAADWNIYHLAGGFTFDVRGHGITLGAAYSFGNAQIGANDLDLDPDLEAAYRRLSVVFGAGFPF